MSNRRLLPRAAVWLAVWLSLPLLGAAALQRFDSGAAALQRFDSGAAEAPAMCAASGAPYDAGGVRHPGSAGDSGRRSLSRRAAVWLAVWLSAPLLLAAQLQRCEHSTDAMGTVFSIVLYSGSREQGDTAAALAFEEVRRLDRMLSNYRPDSEWSEVNRQASDRPVPVSRELFDLLSACLDYSRRSEGAFDITVGPLMKAWGFFNDSGRRADKRAVGEALARIGYAKILLDPQTGTVRFSRAGVEMDPGGIGKGYAVDRMVEVLRQNGIERTLVSAGGSSIYAFGSPPGQEGWPVKIYIREPRRKAREPVPLVLKDLSLSTSGTAEKFFRAGGKVYGHILDPRTGYPVRGPFLVSVVAPRTLDSEAWTTAFLVNGRRWAVEHAPRNFRVFLCEQQPGEPECGWLP